MFGRKKKSEDASDPATTGPEADGPAQDSLSDNDRQLQALAKIRQQSSNIPGVVEFRAVVNNSNGARSILALVDPGKYKTSGKNKNIVSSEVDGFPILIKVAEHESKKAEVAAAATDSKSEESGVKKPEAPAKPANPVKSSPFPTPEKSTQTDKTTSSSDKPVSPAKASGPGKTTDPKQSFPNLADDSAKKGTKETKGTPELEVSKVSGNGSQKVKSGAASVSMQSARVSASASKIGADKALQEIKTVLAQLGITAGAKIVNSKVVVTPAAGSGPAVDKLPEAVHGWEVVVAAKDKPLAADKNKTAKTVSDTTTESAKAEAAPAVGSSDAHVRALREQAEERLSYARVEAEATNNLRQMLESQKEDVRRQLEDATQIKADAARMRTKSDEEARDITRIKREMISEHEKTTLARATAEAERVKAESLAEKADREATLAAEKLSEAERVVAATEGQSQEIEKGLEQIRTRGEELSDREARIMAKEADIDESLSEADRQRGMAIDVLRSLKSNRSDAERLARAAEAHFLDLEVEKKEYDNKTSELDLQMQDTADGNERISRLIVVNEAEAKMLADYEQRLNSKSDRLDDRVEEIKLSEVQLALIEKDTQEKLDQMASELEQAQTETEKVTRERELLRSQLTNMELAAETSANAVNSPGPVTAARVADDERVKEQAGDAAKSLSDAVKASPAIMGDPQMMSKVQTVLSELVGICDGKAASEVILANANELITSLTPASTPG